MAKINILYLLTPIIIAMASFRVVGPIRAAELVVLGVLAYQAARLIQFPTVSRVTFLYILLCASIALVGVWHATITSISFSMRTILALSLFHLLFLAKKPENTNLDYRTLLLILAVMYFYGIYSYRWEFSFIFGCFVIIFYYEKKLLWVVIATCLLFFVGQRTPFVALGLYFGYLVVQKLSFARIITTTVAVATGVLLVNYVPTIAESRIMVTFSKIMSDNFIEIWQLATVEAASSNYEEFVYEDRRAFSDNGDLSAHLRIRKWASAYSDLDGEAFLFGLAPGYFGKGADSGIIRLVASYGSIVFIVFMFYLNALFGKLSQTGRGLLFFLVACNASLDITFSVVIMSFFGILLSRYRKTCNA